MQKLLYAVQGTGNGHISRARVMAPKLQKAGFDVTYLFSGRPKEDFSEMAVFGNFLWRQGLTFEVGDGKIQYLKTAMKNSLVRFRTEVKDLDLSPYELVISDYEPVTCWAAQNQNIPVLGIGHQYAFHFPIPTAGDNVLTRNLMRYFAPANTRLGLHWYHFDQPILPPIVEIPDMSKQIQKDKILVYLPVESISSIIDLLQGFRAFRFVVFHPQQPNTHGPHNIRFQDISRDQFQREFADCNGILTNAGFELASEALLAGKKLLVKPLLGQFEQMSNALALKQLHLGNVMYSLSRNTVEHWLATDRHIQVVYPDTAQKIVDQIKTGRLSFDEMWLRAIWRQVEWKCILPDARSAAA